MKAHRVRQICRAHNRFSPSIALWQHFVLPCHPLRQLRLLSSATEATPTATDANRATAIVPDANETASNPTGANAEVEHTPAPPLGPFTQPEAEPTRPDERKFKIRRLAGARSTYETNGSRDVYTPKNMDAQVRKSSAAAAELMLKAKTAFEGSEDYKGVVVNAMTSRVSTAESFLPWVVQNAPGVQTSGHDRLTLEIARFHDYARPSRTEALARRHLIEQVRTHTREMLPDHVLEVFGSERTGIALANSDIDLRLVKREELADGSDKLVPSRSERKALLENLYALQRTAFSRRTSAYILPNLRYARYPLISLQDRASGIDVQIVCSNDTSASREFMQQYMQEYPYLRQVYTVVKTLFDARGLSDVFRGGFGSYSLFMMLVASLRLHTAEKRDAGGALLTFLRFWSKFDTTTKGITVEPAAVFDKSELVIMSDKTKNQLLEEERKPLPPYMLSLRDPADEDNDLGRKGICIKHVQTTLKFLERKLTSDMNKNTRDSLLYPLVGDVYTINNDQRAKLDRQGRRILDDMHDSIADTARAIREETPEKKTEAKPLESGLADSGSADYGEAVTSALGMPSTGDADADAAADGMSK